MAQVRAVVFDLDGTMLDHQGAALRGLRRWAESLGVVCTDDIEQAWARAELRHFESWRSGEISFAEQRRRRLRDVLPLMGLAVGDDVRLDHTFEGFLHRYEQEWRAYPDVMECLEELSLRGWRLAVLTNGTDDQQRAKLDRIGVARFFEAVFTAEEVGAAKPDRRIFEHAGRSLGVPAVSCLYVGDDHRTDVLGARAAGWRAIHVNRDLHSTLGSDAISDLSTLPDLLR